MTTEERKEKALTLNDLVDRLDDIAGMPTLPYDRAVKLPYAAECMWVGPPPTHKIFVFELGRPLPIPVKVEGKLMESTVFAMFQNDVEWRVYTLGVPDKETKKQLPPMRIRLRAGSACFQERFFSMDTFLAEIADEVVEVNAATATINKDDVLVSSAFALDARAARWARDHGYVEPEEDEEEEEEDDDPEPEQ